jgi:hypothetical protein
LKQKSQKLHLEISKTKHYWKDKTTFSRSFTEILVNTFGK